MSRTFAYFPHTEEDIAQMLKRVSLSSLDELYSDVPEDCKFKGEFDLPSAMSEQQLREYFERLAAKNPKSKVFVGQGAYDHYSPSVIPYLCSRSEFLTAYTPYQCEISQGTLRYIFEYQTMICNLTGLDVSNASLYDGATAAVESVRMCVACTRKRNKVLLSDGLLPNVIETIATYAKWEGIEIGIVPCEAGEISRTALLEALDGTVAGVLLPGTNRFGIVEDYSGLADAVHQAGALFVEYCDPSTLAVIKTPAEWGADIAVGDGQSLGIPLSYGGPYVGFMACRNEYMRKMPGRIVGQTQDAQGRRAFVLTLQAREQHIRREKATSNICSNQSLMALWITVYLSLMGPDGLEDVNNLSYLAAHGLKDALLETGLFEDPYPGKPFIKEFVLKPLCDVQKLHAALDKAGIFAAWPDKEGNVSFCATENRSSEDIRALVDVVNSLK
ncbi:MAG: aminomethyl-transferring glycine dehydrogenase subunit GcvPA [Candidatus Cryptobacteroides sp.]